MSYILTFALCFISFVLIDSLFLGYFMSDYYKYWLSPALTIEFKVIRAFLFYFFYLAGVFIFVINPNLDDKSILKVFLYGAAFGFFCYMTYDLTNWATVKNWPWRITLLDILWGTLMTSIISVLGYKLLNYFV